MEDETLCKSLILVNKLISLGSEKVIENAVIVVEEILKPKVAAFYSLSEDKRYLRLVTKSNSKYGDYIIKKSITLDNVQAIKISIESRSVFVSRKPEEELPRIMVPIVIEGKVKGTLAIYEDLKDLFEEQVNVFEAISKVVESSLMNAYIYENAIKGDRYINNTGVLRAEYFKEIIENKEYFKINNGAEYTLIKLAHKFNSDVEYLYYNLKSQLRGMDYIGLDELGALYLLLSNTSSEEAIFVVDRLLKRGFEAEIVGAFGTNQIIN